MPDSEAVLFSGVAVRRLKTLLHWRRNRLVFKSRCRLAGAWILESPRQYATIPQQIWTGNVKVKQKPYRISGIGPSPYKWGCLNKNSFKEVYVFKSERFLKFEWSCASYIAKILKISSILSALLLIFMHIKSSIIFKNLNSIWSEDII